MGKPAIWFFPQTLYKYIFTFSKQWINCCEICVDNFRKHDFPFINSFYSFHNTTFIDIISFIRISETYNVPTLYCNTAFGELQY